MKRILFALLGIFVLVSAAFSQDPAPVSVGMPGRLSGLVLPGSELEPKPNEDRKAPLVVRLAQVAKHGTAHRYDVDYYGLEPGTYDLRDYLRRKDGSPLGELPAIRVTVEAILPPGQGAPHELAVQRTPYLGGYRFLMGVVGVTWVLGLLVILFYKRGSRIKRATTSQENLSLADRLRPLVESALAGTMARTELATLERALLALWRKRLNLEDRRPHEAMTQLRNHPEAGPLLTQLEAWLHRPGGRENVDIAALLRPYRNMPPEAMDTGTKRQEAWAP